MQLSYRKLKNIFQERGITSYTFKKNNVISQGTWIKIKEENYIDLKSIEALCRYLDVQPGDILEYIPDQKSNE